MYYSYSMFERSRARLCSGHLYVDIIKKHYRQCRFEKRFWKTASAVNLLLQIACTQKYCFLLTFVGRFFFLHTSTTNIIATRITAATGIPIFRALSNVCDVTSIPLKNITCHCVLSTRPKFGGKWTTVMILRPAIGVPKWYLKINFDHVRRIHHNRPTY